MRLYLATSFQNIPEASEVITALRAAQHTLSHNWTQCSLDPDRPAYPQLQNFGRADFRGVIDADALVLINHDALRDAMAEFGIALGRGIPVYVLYPERRPSVFFHRAFLAHTVPELLSLLGS